MPPLEDLLVRWQACAGRRHAGAGGGRGHRWRVHRDHGPPELSEAVRSGSSAAPQRAEAAVCRTGRVLPPSSRTAIAEPGFLIASPRGSTIAPPHRLHRCACWPATHRRGPASPGPPSRPRFQPRPPDRAGVSPAPPREQSDRRGRRPGQVCPNRSSARIHGRGRGRGRGGGRWR